MIVIINGYPGSGKDTFVDMCREENFGLIVLNAHASDIAKEALTVLGWEGEKTPEVRKILSDLTQFSYKYDMPIKLVKRIESFFQNKDSYVVFVHCREKENIERFTAEFGASTLFIDRDSVGRNFSNKSDALVKEYNKYDNVISNNGSLESLRLKAYQFMYNIRFGG